MIEYVKCGIDEDVIRLLSKLGPQFPASSLIVEIENFGCTPNKVYYDGKLYGLLIVRAFRTHAGLLNLVIDHAIAEDDIDQSFGAILAESLWAWAKGAGFETISQHAHRPGLARMLEGHYGRPSEWIYTKDLRSWAREVPHLKQLKAHPAKQQTPA